MSSPAICADAGGAAGATSEPGPSQEPPQEPPHLEKTDQGIEKVMLACQEEGCIKSLAALKGWQRVNLRRQPAAPVGQVEQGWDEK